MEAIQILHMNTAEADASYAQNCTIQRQIIRYGKTILEEAVSESVQNNLPDSMGIADLGCSFGPNTLTVIREIIHNVHHTCRVIGLPVPELKVSLNDLPGNDFNSVLVSLPELYDSLKKDKSIGRDRCFISAMAGSFYGRLYPNNSLHFVHSSSSLHWLSQTPLGLGVEKHMNKGKIYISKTSPECVVEAYLKQFEKDMCVFMRSRAEEMVAGGTMVLSFMGRRSHHPSAQVGSHQWELLAQALMAMAKEGLVEEEKIDSFNAPYYAPSAEEVRNVIEEEGSFVVNRLEAFEIGWDGGSVEKHDLDSQEASSKAQRVANIMKAVVEPMLATWFGTQIINDLFRRYRDLLQDYFTKNLAIHINLVISLTRR